MKKPRVWFFGVNLLLSSLVATPIFAAATQDLQTRLGKVTSFHATFSQRVTSAEGTVIQHGKGKLWIKRPNLFNWQMTSPDENVLISDGKTLWFYNPFVEQATATWLKDATSNTPFMLITRNDPADWQQYNVKQQGDDFELTPKTANGNLKQFAITVTADGVIKTFSAVEQDGQRSAYVLQEQPNSTIDADKFKFSLPKGVTLDDQRQ
ncbi:outer membrane lipoprotein chaperone LolA [Candidatus Fukatsuia symbiotica]|uniref:Outer-membrane lipoprotein carrier protein n=1 Tax=Candidatus Fukatsuia symbiotica TaxID=1878942 RepID=A0A2U8I851_9GAMM|nr:outer membrane lipoprotein chaperone LolA [Candidatus Fukatsuia symbiotica]AWK15372.1 outer-membrane lipoprotein carrier protein [Candidatus Fukatsuia symbiotica]MEA9444670.1 outer membrane lipoprotein chaperone LolA [Candidatus Fukatsuia symbiotica]